MEIKRSGEIKKKAMSHYSEKDSAEVRGLCAKRNAQPGYVQQKVVTEKEWAQLERAGADMQPYITLQDLFKLARAAELKQIRERHEQKKKEDTKNNVQSKSGKRHFQR